MKITKNQLRKLIHEVMIGYDSQNPYDFDKVRKTMTSKIKKSNPYRGQNVPPEFAKTGIELARSSADLTPEEEHAFELHYDDRKRLASKESALSEDHYKKIVDVVEDIIFDMTNNSDLDILSHEKLQGGVGYAIDVENEANQKLYTVLVKLSEDKQSLSVELLQGQDYVEFFHIDKFDMIRSVVAEKRLALITSQIITKIVEDY